MKADPHRLSVAIGLYVRSQLVRLWVVESPNRPLVLKQSKEFPGSINWFESLAHVMNVLDNPNIVSCESFVSTEDQCFIVMPFGDGCDLRRIVCNRMVESQQLICIVQSVATALDDAHGSGFVHGNLHARHILVDSIDHVWLIGFAEFGSVDCSEFRFGNPHHFAPEQLECNLTTPAADIYALAEVCYLFLCGSYPFANCGGIESVMECKQKGRIPSIRERRRDLSQRVDDILQRGMAISPTERYSSAGEFAKELSAALGSRPGKRWWRAYSLLR